MHVSAFPHHILRKSSFKNWLTFFSRIMVGGRPETCINVRFLSIFQIVGAIIQYRWFFVGIADHLQERYL